MPESQHQHPGSNDILIVDDEILNLQLLSGLLGKGTRCGRPMVLTEPLNRLCHTVSRHHKWDRWVLFVKR